MTTQGQTHIHLLQSEYWEYSETVSIETPTGTKKRICSARARLISRWREILAASEKNQKASVEKGLKEGILRKEIEKELREKGGYLSALRYAQNLPFRIDIHTSAFQYTQTLFPRQLLKPKIKEAGVVDEYGVFSEEYLDLYYSLPWESYCAEGMRLESTDLFDPNCSLDDEKVLRSEKVYAQSIVKTPRECEQLIEKLRRAADMLKAFPLEKAAKFLEMPVEDFQSESLLDSRDTLGWSMENITPAWGREEADRILAMDIAQPAEQPHGVNTWRALKLVFIALCSEKGFKNFTRWDVREKWIQLFPPSTSCKKDSSSILSISSKLQEGGARCSSNTTLAQLLTRWGFGWFPTS
ncbi:hypothetical protein CXU17_04670 [Akkermansia muciniphila]|nr:hypothetical protein CXU17_04670 [Akkermansia muciniphila]